MNETNRRQLRVVIAPSPDATMDLLDILLAVPPHVHYVAVVRGAENDVTADLARYLLPSVRIVDPDGSDGAGGTLDHVERSSDVVLRLSVVPVHRRTDRAVAGLLALLHDLEHVTRPLSDEPFARWFSHGPSRKRPERPPSAPVQDDSAARRDTAGAR